MKALAGVAGYELRRSWPVVAVALAGSAAARLMPRPSGDLVLVVGIAAGLVCVARVLGDLASPRRAFLFARPVSASAFWWGKVAAAVVLLAACVAASAAVLLTAGVSGRWQPWNLLAAAGAAVTLGVLAGVFVGGLASRSLAVVGALAAAIALLAWQPRLVSVPIPMAFYWRAHRSDLVTLAVAGGVLVVVLLAGAIATARGRADGRRTASNFTAALCAALVPVVLVNGWWQWRVEGAPAARFSMVRDASVLPGGDWVVVTGGVRPGPEYEVSRLVHLPSGREHDAGMTLTADGAGRSVAWLENPQRFRRERGLLLRVARLGGAGDIEVRDLGISPVRRPLAMALSPSGRWLAMSGGGHVVVTEVMTTKQAVRVPVGDVAQFPLLHFAGEDRLIVVRGPAGGNAEVVTLQLLQVDLRTRQISALADELSVDRGSALAVNADGSRLLAWRNGRPGPDTGATSAGPHVFAVSGGSATRLWAHHPARPVRVAAFLRDGRVAAVEADDDGGQLRVFEAEGGAPLHVVELSAMPTGEPFVPWRIVELSPTMLAAEARRFPGVTAAAWLVDRVGGEVTRLSDGYAPLRARSAFLAYDLDGLHSSVYGLRQEQLFLAPGPSLVARDIATGAMRPVLTMGR